MPVQVLAQQPLVEPVPRRRGTRVGVRVDQPGQQPALGDQLSPGDRLRGPPVTVGVQVEQLATG